MKVKTIVALLLVLALLLTGAGYRQWTAKQVAVHEAANSLRRAGYSDDSPEVQAMSTAWYNEEPFMVWVEEPGHDDAQIPEDPYPFVEAEPLTWEESVRQRFLVIHPTATLTDAEIWTLCNMIEREGGDSPVGVLILIGRMAVNRKLYGTEFPDDIVEIIQQKGQYNPSYTCYSDIGFRENTKMACEYALLMDTEITPELSPTCSALSIPHSAFYHGNFLTGGSLLIAIRSQTSGGYKYTLYFGYDETHCREREEDTP